MKNDHTYNRILKFSYFSTILLLIFIGTTAMMDTYRRNPTTIVVLPLSTFDVEGFVGDNFSKLLAFAFSGFKYFEVLTADEIDEVLEAWEEEGLSTCGDSLACKRQKIADIGFEKVIGGTMKREDGGYSVTLYLYDVDSGEEEARFGPELLTPEDIGVERIKRIILYLFPEAESRHSRYLYHFNLFSPDFIDDVLAGEYAPQEPYYVDGYEGQMSGDIMRKLPDEMKDERMEEAKVSTSLPPSAPTIPLHSIEGIPIFKGDVVPGFYIYYEDGSFFIRWIFGNGLRRFSGIVRVEGRLESISGGALKKEKGDLLEKGRGFFDFYSENGEDGEGRGIEFKTSGDVYFELSINGKTTKKDIYLGEDIESPPSNPFVVVQ